MSANDFRQDEIDANGDSLRKRPAAMLRGGEVDMTPMVDVTFLLLIFFMVTAAFSMQKSIAMPAQQSEQPSPTVELEPESPQVELQIDQFGCFLVTTSDWVLETPGKNRLVEALKEASIEAAGGGEPLKLNIQVHELAKLRWLVDAMDAGTIAGYADLQVTEVEDF